MEDLLVSKSDFEGIRKVAEHCSYDSLVPYIRERQNIDFTDRLGNAFYLDVLSNVTNLAYKDLLDGSDYENCIGHTVRHYGIRRILIHYAYAAYLIEHGYTDTAFGPVQKINEDSLPVPMAELRNLHDRNRRLGGDYFAMTEDYLYHNKDTFPIYKDSNIGCNLSCSCSEQKPMATRRATHKVIKKNP